MLFHPAVEFPREIIERGLTDLDSKSLDLLAVASLSTVLATHDQTVLGAFGCVPIGFLSNEALVWIVLTKQAMPSFSLLRTAREKFIIWATEQPWALYAEVFNNNLPAQHFATFMGFHPVRHEETLIRYKYEGMN